MPYPRKPFKTGKWTWEVALNTYLGEEEEFPGAAPVSLFEYQKAPLSSYWDRIKLVGIVGEIELEASLESYASNKNKKLLSEKIPHLHRKKSPLYWFVEVIQVEGYILKVRFIRFPPNQINQFERWIHYNQLQEIGYYKQQGGIATIPSFTGNNIQSSWETIDLLSQQILDKLTMIPIRFEWLKQEQECIRWKPGTNVEVRNRDCCTEMFRGSVVKTVGRRVQVKYRDTLEKYAGIWVHEDSDLIQPEGWCKSTGAKLRTPMENCDPIPLSPTELGIDDTSQYQLDYFAKIKVGVLFEFINPLRLDEIAVGQVTCVLSHGYFKCRIVSPVLQADLDKHTKGLNEFHYHLSSGQLFPLGTFFDGMSSPSVVNNQGEVEEFDWGSYLIKTGLEALAFPPMVEKDLVQSYKNYMWVEAVDSHQPELVCPAMIVEIVHPYAIKIRFVGWTHEFDQWKPIKSLEVFPIGWCQFCDYMLETPQNSFIELTSENQALPNSENSPLHDDRVEKGCGQESKDSDSVIKPVIPIWINSLEAEAEARSDSTAVAENVEPNGDKKSTDGEVEARRRSVRLRSSTEFFGDNVGYF